MAKTKRKTAKKSIRKKKTTGAKNTHLFITVGVALFVLLTIASYQAVTAYTQSVYEQIEDIKIQYRKEVNAYRREVSTLREEQRVATRAAEEAQAVATKEAQEAKAAAARANSEAARANSEVAAAKATAAKAAKANAPTNTTKLTTAEIERLSQHIMKINCITSVGSGILFNLGRGGLATSVVATNHHVIAKTSQSGGNKNCFVESSFFPYKKLGAAIYVTPEDIIKFNRHADFTAVPLALYTADKKIIPYPEGQEYYRALPYVNRGESTAWSCPSDMPVGSIVYALGYPRYAKNELIVSEGTIIGKVKAPNLPYKNYYTSAKIDSGMSGGAAFSKTADGETCLLGMNTWVSAGKYENAGVIQNWHNLMHE